VMTVGVNANAVQYDVSEKQGGLIQVSYDLEVDNERAGDNHILIHVRPTAADCAPFIPGRGVFHDQYIN